MLVLAVFGYHRPPTSRWLGCLIVLCVNLTKCWITAHLISLSGLSCGPNLQPQQLSISWRYGLPALLSAVLRSSNQITWQGWSISDSCCCNNATDRHLWLTDMLRCLLHQATTWRQIGDIITKPYSRAHVSGNQPGITSPISPVASWVLIFT